MGATQGPEWRVHVVFRPVRYKHRMVTTSEPVFARHRRKRMHVAVLVFRVGLPSLVASKNLEHPFQKGNSSESSLRPKIRLSDLFAGASEKSAVPRRQEPREESHARCKSRLWIRNDNFHGKRGESGQESVDSGIRPNISPRLASWHRCRSFPG